MDVKKTAFILLGLLACLITTQACQAGQTTISATVFVTVPDFLQLEKQTSQPPQTQDTPSFYAAGTPETYSVKRETRWVSNEENDTKQLVVYNTLYPK